LSIKKVNTSGYHPQSDGLVEKFNSTLTAMLSKVAESGKDWDRHLPFVLFAYRNSVQESTKESPFYLLYGRDARLPSQSIMIYMPSAVTGKAWKLATPYHRPYRVVSVTIVVVQP
jgi:hypothetical protein